MANTCTFPPPGHYNRLAGVTRPVPLGVDSLPPYPLELIGRLDQATHPDCDSNFMARNKLRSPSQPWHVQVVYGLVDLLASLKLAVILIFSAAVVLGWATVVESSDGLPAVHFGIYGTWWFTALNVVLALNIFFAAAVRFPWKRHQTGFVITHIGLLTLLFGCYISRRHGIDAQMPIFEGGTNDTAFEDSEHFLLRVEKSQGKAARSKPSHGTDSEVAQSKSAQSKTADRKASASELASLDDGELLEYPIPFVGGPFNWRDYDHQHWLPRWGSRKPASDEASTTEIASAARKPDRFWFPWLLNPRGQGVIHDEDGIKLEVLDYYSDCEQRYSPYLRLWMSLPRTPQMDADGREQLGPEQWMPVEIRANPDDQLVPEHDLPIMQRPVTGGGGQITFSIARSQAEIDAFLNCKPKGPLGDRGQVVLRVAGKTHRIHVSEHLGQGEFALGNSGYVAEVVAFFANPRLDPQAKPDEFRLVDAPVEDEQKSPAIELRVSRAAEKTSTKALKSQRLVLFADIPEFNLQATRLGVFGSYWFDHGKQSQAVIMSGQGGSRIDILQGIVDPEWNLDQAATSTKLYYRYWNRHQVVLATELPTNGKQVNAFKMPIAQLRMYVDRLTPRSKPGLEVVPKPFSKAALPVTTTRAARVRLTVDGNSDEFWVVGRPPGLGNSGPGPMEVQSVRGQGRVVSLSLPLDEVRMNFRVKLNDFEMRLDPGTSQPSHYSSYVEFLRSKDDQKLRKEQVLITMNAPVDFREPQSGRSLRLFQESYIGPWMPGDPEFDEHAQAQALEREQMYASVLTVNFDPGRGIKYIGCALVIGGIAVMFYMRAYFFKPVAAQQTKTQRVRSAKQDAAPQPVA